MKKFIIFLSLSVFSSVAFGQSTDKIMDSFDKGRNQLISTGVTMTTITSASAAFMFDLDNISKVEYAPSFKTIVKKSSKASRILVPVALASSAFTVHQLLTDSDPGLLLKSKSRINQTSRSDKKEAESHKNASYSSSLSKGFGQ